MEVGLHTCIVANHVAGTEARLHACKVLAHGCANFQLAMKKNALLLTTLLLTSFVHAQDDIDRFVEGFIARKKIPGVALLVRRDGQVVKSKGYGLANIEHNVPVTPRTVFQSGSMGKQFTSMAVMMLAEEGRLRIDDPVSKYLQAPGSWDGITLRHMLTHTSGLGDYPEEFDMRRDYTEDELFRMVKASKLNFKPSEKYAYSNLAYLTLGIVIRKVSGKFYGDFLQERVFQPLGMTSTRIISEHDIVPNRAAGYVLRDGRLKNQSWVSPSLNTTADGALYFTIEDLAKWDAALDARKLISEEGYRQMWTSAKLNNGKPADYGFGWRVAATRTGQPVIGHGGAWQGFSTVISRYPAQKLSVVALANRAGADVSYIASRVAGMLSSELALPQPKTVAVPAEALQGLQGEYQNEEQLKLKVEVEGDHLVTMFRGEKLVMRPTSESDFYEEDSDRTYTFTRDAAGAVKSVVVSLPEKMEFKKVR